jgi:hypothetical protein
LDFLRLGSGDPVADKLAQRSSHCRGDPRTASNHSSPSFGRQIPRSGAPG